jgi:predicted ATPase/class 3 adenylate cyclase/DNA-binding CsgD family transcriptional regulator
MFGKYATMIGRAPAIEPLQVAMTKSAASVSATDLSLTERVGLPVGTVTFLLSETSRGNDGSQTENEAESFHNVLDGAINAHGGLRLRADPNANVANRNHVVVAVFSRPSDALMAARTAQLVWQNAGQTSASAMLLVRVRMTVHTGEAQLRAESNLSVSYVGPAIRRATRLHALGHPGQVLVSSASRDLAIDQLGEDIVLCDLGEHRLKDLARPEHVYQLQHSQFLTTFPRLRSLDAFPNNLPARMSTFIGRLAELATMNELFEQHRLVTVVGSGGAGKTRVALQYAADQVGQHYDGVWWVELAPLTQPDAVAVALATVLSISLRESRSPDAALIRALSTSNAMIVFDNCEHVLDSVGRLILLLLANCPQLQILATSRSPLNVPGEVTWRVPPLAVPDCSPANPPFTVEHLNQYESVQLFIDRARIARPTFALSNANGAHVAEICARLDGIPLAIELAAARTKTLLPSQILVGLDDALRILSGGSRLLLPRQQTLEASIRWSQALLDEPARLLLQRLSVFSGSFDLTAAETVCAGGLLNELDVLPALEGLVDQSLIAPVDGANEGRFVALETVRQFGARQLNLSGDDTLEQELRQRHAHYYARLVHEVAPLCETAEQFRAVDQIQAEIANIRSALNFLRERNDGTLATMVISLGPFWDIGGDKFEGAIWATRALLTLTGEPSRERARLLSLRGESRMSLGEWQGCLDDCKAAMAEAEMVTDAYALGRANSTYTTMLSFSSSLDRWRSQWAKTVDLQRAANDRYGLAGTLTWGAVPLLRLGYVKEAAALFRDARVAIKSLGAPGLMASQHYWEGLSAIWEGRPAEAERLCLLALNSGALGSAPRIAAAESVLSMARTQLGGERRSAVELLANEDAADRRGEHLAANVNAMLARSETVRQDPAKARASADDWLVMNRSIPAFDRFETMAVGVIASLRLCEFDDALERIDAVSVAADDAGSVLFRARAKTWRAMVHLLRNETAKADHAIRESIAILWENGVRFFLCEAIEVLAIVAARCSDYQESARLLGAVYRIRTEMQSCRNHAYQELLNETHESVGAAMGKSDFDSSLDVGAALTDEELIAWIERTRGARSRPAIGWSSLTPTELQVAHLVRDGLTNPEIAKRLLMGTETVKTHMSRIFTKLDVSKRSQLAALVSDHDRATRNPRAIRDSM